MLRVVHGPFHPDLEQAFLARLRELRAAGGQVAVVAPSRRLIDRLQRLAAVEGGLSLVDVHFHTFYSLAETLVAASGRPCGMLVADPVFHDRLVDLLLEERPALGRLFGAGQRPRALAAALRASVRDLIDAGVRADQVEEHFGSELLEDPHDRRQLAALLELAAAYEKRLDQLGLLSPSGLTRLAARAAEGSAWLAGMSQILYYGFYDLTGLQLDFFETVTAQAPSTCFFPYRRGHPAFRFADPFFEQKLLGREAAAAPATGSRPAVDAALDGLFGVGRAAALEPGQLEIISVSGARDEAWAAAKEILTLVDSGFCRFEDVGVVARSLEPYRAALAEAFEENGIPFDLAAGEPLLRRPAAKFALNLLTLRRRDFPAAAAADALTSPYFANRPEERTLAHWRALLDRLGIHAGWLQWRKLEVCQGRDFELYPDDERDGALGYRVPARDVDSLWTTVAGWHAELSPAKGSWAELAARARATLGRSMALPEDASESEREALAAVLGAVDSLAAFDLLGRGADWDEFLDALEDKLRRATVEQSPRRGVRILGAMDARGESFEVLFMLGLKEKLFPRAIQEDPILRDAARAALRHPGGYWISTKSAGYEEERLLFYFTAASARRRLYAIYPRSDESGKAEVPSLYLRELCRAAGRDLSSARRQSRLPFEKLSGVAASCLTPRELSLMLAWSDAPAASYRSVLGAEGEWLASSLAALDRLNRFGAAGEHDGVIGPPAAYLDALRRRGLSPSALDSLATCAFQFFAERLLGLRRGAEPSESGQLSPAMKGKIYHAALEKFYGGLGERFWEDGGDWGPVLETALEDVFRQHGWRELGVYPLLWHAAAEQVSRHLRAFLAADVEEIRRSGLRPIWTEKTLEANLPADLPGLAAGLKIRGRLDRLDADAPRRRLRVVDYKTRWKKKGKLAALIARGEVHQLPLYAELAVQTVAGAGVESARIYSIEDSLEATGRPAAHVFEGGQWDAERGAFFASLAQRLEGLAQGRFPINPDDSEFGHCGFCAFARMCRKAHAPTRARSLL